MESIVVQIGWEQILGVITALVLGAWYLSARFTRVEKDVEHLTDRFGRVEADVNYLSQGFGRLEKNFETLRISIENTKNSNNGLFQAQSPVSLTEAGKRSLAESGLQDYIDQHLDLLCAETGLDCKNMNAYEIQEAAFETMRLHEIAEVDEDTAQVYAYEQGISMALLRRVGGIYLRDLCLKKCDMSHDEVDTNDPNGR